MQEVWRNARPIKYAQAPHQQYGASNAPLVPAPSADLNSGPKTGRSTRDPLKTTRDLDIFHQRDRRKASNPLPCLSAEKNNLIAGCDPGQARTNIHRPGNQANQGTLGLKVDVETSPRVPAPQGSFNIVTPALWKLNVGVQKHQGITVADRRSSVHLQGAPWPLARDNASPKTTCQVGRTIRATPIGDYKLVRLSDECGQQMSKPRCLVEHRNDDRQRHESPHSKQRNLTKPVQSRAGLSSAGDLIEHDAPVRRSLNPRKPALQP
jgi:hypothetical protein